MMASRDLIETVKSSTHERGVTPGYTRRSSRLERGGCNRLQVARRPVLPTSGASEGEFGLVHWFAGPSPNTALGIRSDVFLGEDRSVSPNGTSDGRSDRKWRVEPLVTCPDQRQQKVYSPCVIAMKDRTQIKRLCPGTDGE